MTGVLTWKIWVTLTFWETRTDEPLGLSICYKSSFNLDLKDSQESFFSFLEICKPLVGIKDLKFSGSKTVCPKFEYDLDLNNNCWNFKSNSKSWTVMTPSLGNDVDLSTRETLVSTWAFSFLRSLYGSSTTSGIGFGSGFLLV